MPKTTTVMCKVCLEEMKGDVGLHVLNNDSTVCQKMLDISLKTELSIDENPVACNKCKVEIDNQHERLKNESCSKLLVIKEEFKEELNEEIVDDKLMLFNTDIYSYMDTSIIEAEVEHPQSSDCGYLTKNNTSSKYHGSVKLVKCNRCNNHTDTNDCEKSQSVNIITSADRCFSCHMCDYITYNKHDLIEHRRIHKPLKCNLCSYRSYDSGCLKRHLYKHSGEWPFDCDRCDYKTCNKTLFTRHKRTHTDEKPFQCDLCDYCCKDSVSLKTHSYKHSGDWPCICDKCDYKTYSKSQLVRHERTHTRVKQFKCSSCEYRCRQSGALKRHMRKHPVELSPKKTEPI